MTTIAKQPIEAIFNRWQKLLDANTDGALTDILKLFRERDANLEAILNQGINFSDNFNGKILSYTTNATPDTEDAIPHGMKLVPISFIVIDINKGGVAYRSAAFDKTNVYLKCTVASAAIKVFIF